MRHRPVGKQPREAGVAARAGRYRSVLSGVADMGIVLVALSAILTAWGMGPEHAEITAEILIEADLRGVESHGLSMLPVYQDMLFKINLKPNIQIGRAHV